MATLPDKHIDFVVDGAAFSFLATFVAVDQNEAKRTSKGARGALRGTPPSPGWTTDLQQVPLKASASPPSRDHSCWLRIPGRSRWNPQAPCVKPRRVVVVSAAKRNLLLSLIPQTVKVMEEPVWMEGGLVALPHWSSRNIWTNKAVPGAFNL